MQRIFLAFCLLLASALPCRAQGEKPKPNTLTPKEIADGWILLFDGETTFGWRVRGEVSVSDGWLVVGGKEESVAMFTTDFPWTCAFCYDAYQTGDPDNAAGVMLFERRKNGTLRKRYSVIGKNAASVSTGWDPKSDAVKSSIELHAPAGVKLYVRSLMLKCGADSKSLFNGKDLAGWKEFAGKKSTFTVSDGAINVKNGPGDLQTVGKYQDFVLQLEAISNGKHLNSGIFFRCKDNEYQNGYEAQILNKFSKEATQNYLVEEYDPTTNKLTAKKEVLSPAFDFGTGAIYRRVPARKEMSKDGEWFGMTIVAHGNHIATWVNGVQVVDWTDNRPKSDNARTGCKLEAGHISIQGHDPTTDLSFKNFRIAEFATGK